MVDKLQPHIRCTNEIKAKYAILPGDPERVERIKEFLDDARDISFNREFKSAMGYYKGVKVIAISTGIGGTSTGIAVEELKNIGVKTLIRIGSCGALQKELKLGDLIIGNGAVRNEGTSLSYIEKGYPAVPDVHVLMAILESAKQLGYSHKCGIIRSHDSFYTDEEEKINNYWASKGVLGADMESAALFVIGGIRGLRTASILNVVVESNGNLETGINEYVNGESLTAQGEKKEILTALEAIVRLNNKEI